MRQLSLAVFLMFASVAATFPVGAIELGEKLSDVEFKDTWYSTRTLKDLGEAKAFVFVFLREGCPEAEAAAPNVRALEADYAAKGAAFVMVDSWDEDNETAAAWFALRNELHFPVVKDWDATCAKALGVTRAPSAVVLDAGHVLRYRGRIADGDHHDLADALDAVLAGNAPATATTEAAGCDAIAPALAAPANAVTYANDIAPVINESCVSCHCAGGQAPFDLSTYDAVASHANMVAEVMREGRMPPWYAHPAYGKFSNDRRVAPEKIAQVRQWVAGGKLQGDVGASPDKISLNSPLQKGESGGDADANGWHIQPDLIVSQPGASAVPPTGVVPYQYVLLPHVFEEDCYVTAIEIKPDNPRVLHHGNLAFTRERYNVDQNSDFLTGTVPGGIPSELQPGTAWCIPKGATLLLQLHLVTTGKFDKCKVSVGMTFARGKVDKLLYYHNFDDNSLELAPHERAHRDEQVFKLEEDVSALGMFAHMHLRGKSMTFAAEYPDGRNEWLMALPNYSFDWQITYTVPAFRDKYPAGTTIRCNAYYDNSRWNPFNPAPDTTVKQGPQTTDEMMNGFFVYTKDAEHLALEIDPTTGFAVKQVALATP